MGGIFGGFLREKKLGDFVFPRFVLFPGKKRVHMRMTKFWVFRAVRPGHLVYEKSPADENWWLWRVFCDLKEIMDLILCWIRASRTHWGGGGVFP